MKTKIYPITQEILELMPNVRHATFWEALWNRISGKILWWLMLDNK